MHENLIQQLKGFKYIEPDSAFAAKSRSLILAAKPSIQPLIRPIALIRIVGAFAVLIIVFLTIRFLSPTSPSISSSFNSEGLSREFNDLSINIELREITYQQTINLAIASALNEISENRTPHLSPDLLELEKQNIDFETSPKNQIDNLLNELIF